MAWSKEANGLVRVVAQSGHPHIVTSVCRVGRAQDSYHNKAGTMGCGLAVDFAGPKPFNERRPHPPLSLIWAVLAEHSAQLAELFYSGAPFFVKDGVRYPIEILSPAVKNAHWNHVHAAVARGVVLVPATITAGQGTLGGVSDPNVIPSQSPVVNLVPTPTGKGYWIITVRGEVFSFGDAQYFGRVEYLGEL
jgi:hypothetical protein